MDPLEYCRRHHLGRLPLPLFQISDMARLGEKVLAITPQGETSGMVAISVRSPTVGSKVLAIETDAGTIAVQPMNAYDGDEGIGFPLPCGATVFLPSEPPNYLPPSWESGFGMSCQQGVPQTNGWTCSGSCPINPSYHPTPGETCRRAYRLPLLWTDANACTHSLGSGSWRANKEYHWDVTITYYGCGSKRCYQIYEDGTPQGYKVYCKLYGTETAVAYQMVGGVTSGTKSPKGCYNTNNRFAKRSWKAAVLDGQLVDAFYSYACNGPKTVCPRFNGGSGLSLIHISEPTRPY